MRQIHPSTHYVSKTDTAVYAFHTGTAAWDFVHRCDAAKLSAGFPSLDGKHTVKVAIPTWMAREVADKLAGVPCVAYHFAGEEIPHT